MRPWSAAVLLFACVGAGVPGQLPGGSVHAATSQTTDARAAASTNAGAGQAADNHGKFPTIGDAFQPSSFAARRARLAPLVGNGVVVLFGEKNPIDAWEEHANDPFFRVGPFRQEENFFYLTGLSFPDLAVVIDPANHETLVYSPETATAPGHADGGADLRAAAGRLGLGTPRPMARLEGDLEPRIKSRPVYLLVRSDALATAFNPQHVFAPFLPGAAPDTYREDITRKLFERRFPGVTVKSIVAAMVQLRKVLDPDEIAAMRRVVSISAAGLRRGIGHVAPGVDEREVAAEIEYEFKKRGAQLIAYGADLQSGPNGMRSFIDVDTSYDLRNRTMQAGETALIDHSAEVNYYVSDLARTVPVSGKFTSDQRLAYDTYLAAYEAGLAAIKPGAPYMAASEAAGRAMEARLSTLPEWLRGPAADFAKAVAKGTPGHFLGMNLHIHDDYTSPLVAGQVVAYESAFKIPQRGWRFTAEDVVLVTPNGHDVLSADLPRTADGIEQMMVRRSSSAR
jgi:Xaa-Pro aminopeptidase